MSLQLSMMHADELRKRVLNDRVMPKSGTAEPLLALPHAATTMQSTR
jgi:hypothetical protein